MRRDPLGVRRRGSEPPLIRQKAAGSLPAVNGENGASAGTKGNIYIYINIFKYLGTMGHCLRKRAACNDACYSGSLSRRKRRSIIAPFIRDFRGGGLNKPTFSI